MSGAMTPSVIGTVGQRLLSLAHQHVQAKAPSSRIQHVSAFAFSEKDPPKEMQLWNVGDNPTDYGVHRWTDRSIAAVMGRYEERGNPLLVDVEHNGAKMPDGEPAITGGYARLEIRAGAPWLVFDWSAYALAQIAAGERRFLSPEYDVDQTTGEIIRLCRVSLVADPGTHRARMLATAGINQEKEMDIAMILAALRAALAAEDPAIVKESISNLVAEIAKGAGGDAGGGETPPPADSTQAADAPPPPADKADDDKPRVAAGAAPAKPASPPKDAPPASTVAATAPTVTVDAAAAKAVRTIEDAQRDLLLQTEGDRLLPPIRAWASSQPLATVQGLLAATPARQEPSARVAATRGDTQGLPAKPKGLEGKDLEELQKGMGTFKASTELLPHTSKSGNLVLPTTKPSELRRIQAEAAAKVASGKAGA